MKIAFILLGAPGSGKGTQGELLSKNFNLKRYIMSDLLKKEIKENKEIKEKIEKGELVSDDEVLEVFKKYFERDEKFLLDGIPRTYKQAKLLTESLEKENYKIIVLYLKVNEELLLERITNRYYCPKCHASYNLKFKPPKKDTICDYDGEKLVQRKDDTEEVFKKRLKIFNKSNKEILKYYKERLQKYYEFDGSKSLEEVHKDMFKILKEILSNK